MTEKLKSHPEKIATSAITLFKETSFLGVKTVTFANRNKVQAVYKKLLGRTEFIKNIQSSRPNARECHLIFSPHLPKEKCLGWWIFPYSEWSLQPDHTYEIFCKPCFAIDPTTGAISDYWGEDGTHTSCGYDK